MYGGSFQDLDGHVWEVMYMEQAAEQQAEGMGFEPMRVGVVPP